MKRQKFTLTEILQGSKYYLTRVDPFSYASSSLNIRGFDSSAITSSGPGVGIQGTGSDGSSTRLNLSAGSYEDMYFRTYSDGKNDTTFKVMRAGVCTNAMQLISSINVNGKAVLSEAEGGGFSFTSLADGDPDERWIIHQNGKHQY